jgi:hypothetical protein
MPAIDFDMSGYDAPPARAAFDPLPPGDYHAIITDSQMKDTKAGTGQYVELVMQIIEGEFSGRKLWERLNVVNPNKQAEDIARSQLKSLSGVCGVEPLRDTEQLHDTPFIVSLEIDRKEPTRNRVMGYKSAKSASAPAARPAARSAAVAAPAAAKKPWER